jgi:hypothetical protein
VSNFGGPEGGGITEVAYNLNLPRLYLEANGTIANDLRPPRLYRYLHGRLTNDLFLPRLMIREDV